MNKPYKTLIRYTEINGIPLEVKVSIYVGEDHDTNPFDMDFDSEASKKSYVERFENGELFNAWINVIAEASGERGSDALCNVHLHRNNMFNSEPFEYDLNTIIEVHGMINEAIEDLRTTIINRANTLKQFTDK